MARKAKDYKPGPFDYEHGYSHKAAWGHMRRAIHNFGRYGVEVMELIEQVATGRDDRRSPRLPLMAAIWHFCQLSEKERHQVIYDWMKWSSDHSFERAVRREFGVPLIWKDQPHPGAIELMFDTHGLLSGVAIAKVNSFNDYTLTDTVKKMLAERANESTDDADFRDAMRKLGFDMEAA